ncbi:MAG: hypothetical protein ACAI25_06985 [Planctomycetota bacterium]
MPTLTAADLATDLSEAAWWDKLSPEIKLARLEKGDILLKKDVKDYAKYSGAVVLGQTLFRATNASKRTVHATIYVGDGKVAHARHLDTKDMQRVMLTPLQDELTKGGFKGIRFVVYRPLKKELGVKAAELARAWAERKGKDVIGYSAAHCLNAIAHSSTYGPDAKARTKKIIETKQPPEPEMMCSEFAVYCYQQDDVENPYIKLDGKHTAPIRLEEFLNGAEGSKRFAFRGRFRP